MTTNRRMNFAPGPAALPLPVLERIRDELVDFRGTGMSMLEHSHRGKTYVAVHEATTALVREVLGVPDTHQVLFLQGGARQQFAQVPMNLLTAGRSADYVVTGTWSEQALSEAKIVGTARVAATTREDDGAYRRVPRPDELDLDPGAAYVHLTSNNTIFGTQFHELPDTGAVPLIADGTSDLAARRFDVSRFGVLYAAAQKNLGMAGVTLVIVRKDLIHEDLPGVPKILRWATPAAKDSMHNTTPTFAVYVMGLVLDWVKSQGGLDAIEGRNRSKAERVYGALDAHAGFYALPVEKASRSWANAVFRLPTPELEKTFLAEADAAGMIGLKGHRSVGGVRVSLYSGVEPAWADAVASLIGDFARRHG